MDKINKHIFWISSYPKSGNTLLRAILSSIFFTNDGLFNFELLKNIPQIENTINLEFIKNSNPKDYNEIHKLEVLSKYWETIQSKKNLEFEGDFIFIKTHHALIEFLNNSFTSRSSTRGLIYVVRDPRDVVISFAHHYNISIDKSIDTVINKNYKIEWQDPNNIFSSKKKPFTFLSSWDFHYESWVENPFGCPQLLIKYEEMISDKFSIINNLIKFFENNYNFKFSNIDIKIKNIIESTDFQLLKKNEQKYGFSEAVNNKFFNIGTKNQWENKLTKDQILKVEKRFYKLMKKLGYKTNYYNE